jgi:hypothetical protein
MAVAAEAVRTTAARAGQNTRGSWARSTRGQLSSTRLDLVVSILSRAELTSQFDSLTSQLSTSSSQLVSSNELAFIYKQSIYLYLMN